MDDEAILHHLRWIYHERTLCAWCRHPSRRPVRRGLCSTCYQLALEFRRDPTPALAVAIGFAIREGMTNPADRPIEGLDLEQLLERLAQAAVPWRGPRDNPFSHSANIWGESYSDAQRRLLYHYLSLVDRELIRKARRGRAWTYAHELRAAGHDAALREHIERAIAAVRVAFRE